MKKVYKFNLILLLMLSASVLFAQEDVLRPKGKPGGGAEGSYSIYKKKPFTIGFEGGLNYNMFSQDLSWIDPITTVVPLTNSPLKTLESGSGISAYFGVLADIPFNDKLGLQIRGTLDWKYFKNSYTGDAESLNDNNTLSYGKEDVTYNISGLYGGLGALLRLNITPNLIIMAGPIVQFPIGDFKSELTQTILTDGMYLIDVNNNRVKSITTNGTLESINTRVSFEFDLGYKIPISKTIWLVPQARFQYGLTRFTDDSIMQDITMELTNGGYSILDAKNAKLHSLQFVLSLWFDL